ncbi:MAG: nicotinamide mononucleotide transporter [Nanoarchaeota archaeon]|nr:nicotinamide mononucleotide transporter [Nanoarchaeota archaeon]
MKKRQTRKKGIFHRVYVIEKTLIHHVIEWIATILSLTGAFMIAYKYVNGYYVWIVANALWIFFAWKHKHYGLLVLSISYMIINIVGLVKWGSL